MEERSQQELDSGIDGYVPKGQNHEGESGVRTASPPTFFFGGAG